MGVLSRYLLRFVLTRLAAVLFAIVCFAFLIDLLDASEDLLGRSDSPVRDLLVYTGLRTPSLLSEILPFALLLGGLFAATDLIRHRELVAIWNAGLSSAGIALRLLPLALLLAVGKYGNDDRLIPASVERLRDWGVGLFSSLGPGRDDRWLWVAADDTVLRFHARAAREGKLREIAIFRRNAEGLLVERILAAEAEVREDGLLLHQVDRRPLGQERSENMESLLVPVHIDLEAVALMTRPASELSRADLLRVVAARGFGMQPIHAHRTWLYHRPAAALAVALLLLLPFALARSVRRVGGTTALFLRALALGFGYQIGNGLLVALGEGGFLAPTIAAWGAPSLLALTVLGLLLLGEVEGRRASAMPAEAARCA
ncbi:hypothetical protein HRbin40_00923 [bacterium HR40]|nr:hypothetical protein HRbin40_00923 [bacterium HR40]